MSLAPDPPRPPAGLVGALFVDHVGLRVPDLAQAVAFFVDVLGCDLLFEAGPWPAAPYRAASGATREGTLTLALLRAGPNLNVELLHYAGDDAPERHAGPLAGFVRDVDAALAAVAAAPGVRLVGAPETVPDGPSAGLRYGYFESPWGLLLEVISYPEALPYTRATAARAYRAAGGWRAAASGA